MPDLIKIIVFSIVINWCISMQMLNQNSNVLRQKNIAVFLSLLFGAVAGVVLIL